MQRRHLLHALALPCGAWAAAAPATTEIAPMPTRAQAIATLLPFTRQVIHIDWTYHGTRKDPGKEPTLSTLYDTAWSPAHVQVENPMRTHMAATLASAFRTLGGIEFFHMAAISRTVASTLIAGLQGMTSITGLSLVDLPIQDADLPAIGSLTSIEFIQLTRLAISAATLPMLPKLEGVDIIETPISEPGLQRIFSQPAMIDIVLDGVPISAESLLSLTTFPPKLRRLQASGLKTPQDRVDTIEKTLKSRHRRVTFYLGGE